MKPLVSIGWFLFAICFIPIFQATAQVNVTQFHNHDSRDGLYIDAAFTRDAAANLTRDLHFDGTIAGKVCPAALH